MEMAENWCLSFLEEEAIASATAALTGVDESSSSSSVNLDDSLTSLQWLQEFSIINSDGNQRVRTAQPSHDLNGYMEGSEGPSSPFAADTASMGMPHTPGKPTSSASICRSVQHPGLGPQGEPLDEVDYRTNPHVKPPYSYATLICMAMQASKKSKIMLSDIYKWITDNYCYFKHADPTWQLQNSIRHNLSLNKCFIKVPREKDEPGKGGFWKIDPQYADRLLSGAFKKRRMPPVHINPAFQTRMRQEPILASIAEVMNSQLCVSQESQQLLKEFEEVTSDQNWDLSEMGKISHKRKQPLPKRMMVKAPRRSSSPLLTTEEQKELGSLKGDFDWDAILDSALSSDLGEELEHMPPLSPIPGEVNLTIRGTHIDRPQQWSPLEPGGHTDHILTQTNQGNLDFDEETFLATAFLQNPWEEGRNDFLSNSAVNLDQLFGLSDSFSCNRIEAFL
ncbi:forkhead box protein J1-B-like isoform X1 [Polyodon spathula]|uniref:forkhead box protein J1-B-like isoform X1 n=1 Tax=Polyodon spathula TaxID=7913 RepID=UPI001B7F0598|nr:forkhead box protein J1-B-like isoform X1 [Polyodon spathula]XP_041077087.1 forkhead box protein J1-B-like isoform X1 [Polyodon spathula]